MSSSTNSPPDNDLFWKKCAPTFERHKEQDPQPIWFFKEWLLGDDFNEQTTVLDIGCGSGRGMLALKEIIGSFPIGFDLSKEALEQAQKRGVPSDKLILGNIHQDPLPLNIDVVWCSDLFLYFDPDKELDLVMKKICAALKNGGRLGLRWSVGEDSFFVKKTNSMFLVSKQFIQTLLEQHDLELVFIEQRKDPIYIADNHWREGRNVYEDHWYILATKKT